MSGEEYCAYLKAKAEELADERGGLNFIERPMYVSMMIGVIHNYQITPAPEDEQVREDGVLYVERVIHEYRKATNN